VPDLFETLPLPWDQPADTPPDHDNRELALDITRSWIVEAPAGSGKTGLLIQRYLKLLAADEVERPEQVLAITFTEKATAEIRERILRELARAQDHSSTGEPFQQLTHSLAVALLEKDRALQWQLLTHPHRLNIRTIDSVCMEIQRSLPVLSGGGGALSPVDDPDPLYREAARRTLLELGGSDPALDRALRLVLLHRDGNLPEVERLIADMLRWRDQWGELIPLAPAKLNDAFLDAEVLPNLEQTLRELIAAQLTSLVSRIPAGLLEDLCSVASALASRTPYNCAANPLAPCNGRLPRASAEDLPHWQALAHLLLTKTGDWRRAFRKDSLQMELTRSDRERLTSLLESFNSHDHLLPLFQTIASLPSPIYPAEQWTVAKSLFRILGRALAELQLAFAARQQCDFTELSLLARTALRP